jgi:hypothetical protein
VDPLSVISAFDSAFGVDEKTVEGKDAIDLLTLPQRLILCSVLLTLKRKICTVKDLTLMHVSELINFSQYMRKCDFTHCSSSSLSFFEKNI